MGSLLNNNWTVAKTLDLAVLPQSDRERQVASPYDETEPRQAPLDDPN